MKKVKEYFNIPDIGPLYIDKVLFQAHAPIFFTLTDKSNNLYICTFCSETKERNMYIIVPVKPKRVIDILEDKIPIRQLFTEAKDRYTVIYDGEYHYYLNDINSCDESVYLPIPNGFMETDENEYDEEIKYFKNFKGMYYDNN